MKRIFFPASVIITSYGGLLLLLAFFFLMRDNSLHKLQSAVPWLFIYRFCTFWFISLVLAVVFFVVNLNPSQFSSTSLDKAKARRMGLLTFGLGALIALMVVGIIYIINL